MTTVDTGFDPLTRVGSAGGTKWAVFEWGSRGPFTAVGVAMSGFSDLNARYGHQTGDEVLIEVARRIGATIPPVPDSYLGRIGGDSFLVLAAISDVQEASILARRIREAVEVPLRVGVANIEPRARLVVVPVHAARATPMTLPGLPSSWSIGGKERPDLIALVRAALDRMPPDGDPILVLEPA